jgi:(5-formylfuran-3-yl)methyl phosphate synthase
MSKIKLLVSVKNTQEAMLAAEAGVDFIDLKDPEVGALGSLCNTESQAIVRALQGQVSISATIGDEHSSWQSQLAVVQEKIAIGLTIIKLPITAYFDDQAYVDALSELIQEYPIKLIGVFFADENISLDALQKLAAIGFYGAMLDTKFKQNTLLSAMTQNDIALFVKLCKLHQLEIGLAGALRLEYLDELMQHQPGYVGFRSGVCESNCRKNGLLAIKVKEINDKLHKHNNLYAKITT